MWKHYARLKALRVAFNHTQAEIGKIIGCSQVAYSHYERGARVIPLDLLVKLADHYNTSIDYLLERTDTYDRYPATKK